MTTVYIVHSDMEGAIHPIRAFPTREAALQHVGDTIEEYRENFGTKHVIVTETASDGDRKEFGICHRMAVRIVDCLDSVEQEFVFTIYEDHLLILDKNEEERAPVPSNDLPTEPGYYEVMYKYLRKDGKTVDGGTELCEVDVYGDGTGLCKLTARSMLFEILFPTQGNEMERNHLTQPLENLEEIEGVRLYWTRLVPETRTQTKNKR
ncbi:MAG: hypothetical protein FWD31_15025 [Planctomycetaceae bacterium]|nr:hypothetical protein [Planctomycetaceae bacterium]